MAYVIGNILSSNASSKFMVSVPTTSAVAPVVLEKVDYKGLSTNGEVDGARD